jgi:hypothetical protein
MNLKLRRSIITRNKAEATRRAASGETLILRD